MADELPGLSVLTVITKSSAAAAGADGAARPDVVVAASRISVSTKKAAIDDFGLNFILTSLRVNEMTIVSLYLLYPEIS
ncbi:MAG: hypothetical protein J5I90_02905 [Caldilineales bacterium]|nr:hypothetical protein [Caldilineales bacterium]